MASKDRSLATYVAIAVGITYTLVGIVGFVITGPIRSFAENTGDKLIGFSINPFHNLVHLVIGLYLLIMSRFSSAAVEGALIGGGAVYLLAAFLGFTNDLQILSINSATEPDNFLHLVSGAAALIVGLLTAAYRGSSARRRAGAPA